MKKRIPSEKVLGMRFIRLLYESMEKYNGRPTNCNLSNVTPWMCSEASKGGFTPSRIADQLRNWMFNRSSYGEKEWALHETSILADATKFVEENRELAAEAALTYVKKMEKLRIQHAAPPLILSTNPVIPPSPSQAPPLNAVIGGSGGSA